MTSEKQAPSPISMAAEIGEAIKAEKAAGRCGAKTPLKDSLGKVIAEYNKLTTIKRHRIESNRRALIYNLPLGTWLTKRIPQTNISLKNHDWVLIFANLRLRSPTEVMTLLHSHYDAYKSEVSGLGVEKWVPNHVTFI